MPVFVENPVEFSKQRLKSELIRHKVKLPPADSEKQVYVELYMKHVGKKSSSSPDFSSDEEEQVLNGNEEDETGDEAGMVDLSSLTDDQLKHKLLQYGIKPGPIVGSTRRLYEKKLLSLMTHHSQHSVHSKSNAGKFSDSEEDEEEENEEDSGSEKHGSVSEASTTHSMTGLIKERFYPQCFVPPVTQVKNREQSLENSQCSSQNFSITQLVEEGSVFLCLCEKENGIVLSTEIENRLTSQSEPEESERRNSQTPMTNRTKWLSKNTMTSPSLYLNPECLPRQKQATTIKPSPEAVTDVLTEMFPDAVVTPTGITATKRRSIKGAAGRPVQFKYPQTPASPATLERRGIQQHLVPLWVQVVVFLLVAALLYVIYILMEELPENPFSTLLDGVSQEPVSEELILNSQETNT